jgi:hypothetical protein
VRSRTYSSAVFIRSVYTKHKNGGGRVIWEDMPAITESGGDSSSIHTAVNDGWTNRREGVRTSLRMGPHGEWRCEGCLCTSSPHPQFTCLVVRKEEVTLPAGAEMWCEVNTNGEGLLQHPQGYRTIIQMHIPCANKPLPATSNKGSEACSQSSWSFIILGAALLGPLTDGQLENMWLLSLSPLHIEN